MHMMCVGSVRENTSSHSGVAFVTLACARASCVLPLRGWDCMQRRNTLYVCGGLRMCVFEMCVFCVLPVCVVRVVCVVWQLLRSVSRRIHKRDNETKLKK